MLLRHKLLVGAVVIAALPATLIGFIGTWTAGSETEAAMELQVRDHLVSVRDSKRRQIEGYLERVHNQIAVLSDSPTSREAIQRFRGAVAELTLDSAVAHRQELGGYYDGQFGRVFREKNPQSGTSPRELLQRIDDVAATMQYHYIQANRHPLGSKHLLDAAADGSEYSRVHGAYHPYFRHYLEAFGYYDIFLVEPDKGRIVYSVFKELDYGTSLESGPYANTGIAEAYRRAKAAGSQSAVVQTDYATYVPSYNGEAAFIASPITSDGRLDGILVFQIPIDKINAIMTSDGRWQDEGLGDSGETYLVGNDKRLRSESRFWLQDRDGYLQALANAGVDDALADDIRNHGSTVGRQQVDASTAAAALRGETGFAIVDDYRGVAVLSAYAPVEIPGLNWAILSEIDRDEAFAPAHATAQSIAWHSLLAGVVVVVAASLLGLLFARSVSAPINSLTGQIREIGEHADLSREVELSRSDELGAIASALNGLFASFRATIVQIDQTSGELSVASAQLQDAAAATRAATESQRTESDQMATAVEEMAATSRDVAQNASNASAFTNEANDAMLEGRDKVSLTNQAINDLAGEVMSVDEIVGRLKADSEAIGGVLDVIRSVAEQTNLLALNAAIEAARAGEQGRGFAVVADEVRTLASRTQNSTEEIQAMIESVQTGADRAALGIRRSREQSDVSVERASEADQALSRIADAIGQINDMTHQIATAAEEQSAVSTQISASVHQIAEATTQTAGRAGETASASASMQALAAGLAEAVRRFRT